MSHLGVDVSRTEAPEWDPAHPTHLHMGNVRDLESEKPQPVSHFLCPEKREREQQKLERHISLPGLKLFLGMCLERNACPICLGQAHHKVVLEVWPLTYSWAEYKALPLPVRKVGSGELEALMIRPSNLSSETGLSRKGLSLCFTSETLGRDFLSYCQTCANKSFQSKAKA